MAKDKAVWIVRWTYIEYGGPSHGTQPSYHLTREEAEEFKKQREGPIPGRTEKFYKDGFEYSGSQPTLEYVSKSEYERIKALGQGGGILGPSR